TPRHIEERMQGYGLSLVDDERAVAVDRSGGELQTWQGQWCSKSGAADGTQPKIDDWPGHGPQAASVNFMCEQDRQKDDQRYEKLEQHLRLSGIDRGR